LALERLEARRRELDDGRLEPAALVDVGDRREDDSPDSQQVRRTGQESVLAVLRDELHPLDRGAPPGEVAKAGREVRSVEGGSGASALRSRDRGRRGRA